MELNTQTQQREAAVQGQSLSLTPATASKHKSEILPDTTKTTRGETKTPKL
ncbi:MAG: hypothetical protein LBJ00_03735 [Planctomycetaceae bacterium]|nr:hypothetical protein [Planctomycetaceae bacterium]